MKRTYESMVLLDNREVKKGWQNLKTEVCGVFEKHGAEIKSARRWDERRLAFPVKRQLRGTYCLIYFESETDSLTAIRRDLEYAEPVLRHLTQVCETVPETAFEPEEAFDESAVKVEDTGTLREAAAAEAATSASTSGKSDQSAGSEDESKAAKSESEGDSESGDDAGEPSAEASAEKPDAGDETKAETPKEDDK